MHEIRLGTGQSRSDQHFSLQVQDTSMGILGFLKHNSVGIGRSISGYVKSMDLHIQVFPIHESLLKNSSSSWIESVSVMHGTRYDGEYAQNQGQRALQARRTSSDIWEACSIRAGV